MSTKLKNSIPYVTYSDPITKVKIGPGKIVEVQELTVHMKKRIRAGGLIVIEDAPKETPQAPVVETAPVAVAPEVKPEAPKKTSASKKIAKAS